MNAKLLFLIAFLLSLLAWRFASYNQPQYREGEKVQISARLLSTPEQKGKVQSFSIRPKYYEPIYISAPLYPEYQYGQILTVTGRLKLSDGEKKVFGRHQSEPSSGTKKVSRSFASMSYPEISVRENDSLLYGLIGFIREKVTRIYQEALPQTGASLLMGVVFGIKQGIPEEFKDALSQTGVTHVIAASGMNVTLIAGAFMVIFGAFLRRQAALVFSILGIFFYAFLAGFEPSIVRASIMGSIVFLSGILGRQNTALWTLCLTGYIMLLWNPVLISDVGFQLSFLATLGILIVKPALYLSRNSPDPSNDKVVIEDLKTTIAAQLGTIPILLSAFGQVSFLSLLVNMVVLWTVPILMFIGSMAAIVGFFSETLGKLIALFALPFLLYFEWVVMFFAKFNWVFQVEDLSWQWMAGYYGVLGLFVWKRRRGFTNYDLGITNKAENRTS